MSTTRVPPKIPSVPAGISASEWASTTESILSSDSVADEPAAHSRPQELESTSKPVSTTAPDVTTPGVPGSYPKEHEKQVTQGKEGEQGPLVGASVVQTAKQYMPSQVERGLESAGQVAAPYIPEGVRETVMSYWKHDEEMQRQEEHHTSLPSTELKGAQPSEHTGGVGALPGTISESSVALLPDERAARNARTPTRTETPKKEAVGAQAANVTRGTATGKDEQVQPQEKGARGAKAPARLSKPDPIPIPFAHQLYPPRNESAAVSATPDKDKELPPRPAEVKERTFAVRGEPPAGKVSVPSQLPQAKTSQDVKEDKGVASGLPGGRRSQSAGDVGREAKTAASAAASVGTAAAVASERGPRNEEENRGRETTSKMVGQGDKGRERRDVLTQIEELKQFINQKEELGRRQEGSRNENAGTQRSGEEEGKKHTLTTQGSAYGGDYHPAKLHPPPPGASVAEYGPQEGVPAAVAAPKQEPAQPSPVVTQHGNSGSRGRKVSFIAKVKGEAKIIAGKMSGREEKVEEGKRMMHGDL